MKAQEPSTAATYLARIKAERGGGFSVDFPDVPGAISMGDTFEEAVANAREALELILEAHAENGGALPVASDPGKVSKAIVAGGAIAAAIAVDLPGRVVRVNLTFDEALLTRIDRAAEKEGRTRSGFLAEAARERIAAD